MAGFTVITDVGNELVRILREHMVPDVIPNADAIGLCHPSDKGDFMLGLHLYDVREDSEIFEQGLQNAGMTQMRYPSKYLELYFMVTPYSMSDVKFRSAEEYRILGKTMQVLMDYGIISSDVIGSANSTFTARAELLKLDMEEKMKLWNMPDTPYKTSLYYKVAPIELESTKRKKVSRVTDVTVEAQVKP